MCMGRRTVLFALSHRNILWQNAASLPLGQSRNNPPALPSATVAGTRLRMCISRTSRSGERRRNIGARPLRRGTRLLAHSSVMTDALFWRGPSNSQTNPPASKRISTGVPSSVEMASRIRREPNPSACDGVAGGPPLSFQMR